MENENPSLYGKRRKDFQNAMVFIIRCKLYMYKKLYMHHDTMQYFSKNPTCPHRPPPLQPHNQEGYVTKNQQC